MNRYKYAAATDEHCQLIVDDQDMSRLVAAFYNKEIADSVLDFMNNTIADKEESK